MRKIFTLCVALFATTVLMAADFEVNGIAYDILGGDSVEVTSGGSYSGTISIPASITYNSTTYRVTSIGDLAFSYCTSLSSVTLPNSVTSIGDLAFFVCTSLSSIDIDAANTHYASVDGVLFNYAKDTLIQYPIGNSRTEYTIPNSVVSIGDDAFSNCTSLSSVTIPNSVTSIGVWAFGGCTSLSSVTIPNSVTSIGFYAFSECSPLSSITCYATTPPTCGSKCFDKVDKSIPLYVLANSISAYKEADEWKDFTNILPTVPYEHSATITTSDPLRGIVFGGGIFKRDSTITIAASAFAGYQFSKWSDGNQEEARCITLTSDTNLIAYFTPHKADTVIIHDTTFIEVHDTTYVNLIEVNSINPAMGSAVLQAYAIPEEGYQFMYWSDYDSTNPRTIETSDQPQTFTAVFTPETPTPVREVAEDSSDYTKIVRDGQLLILRDGKTYNAQGGEL